MFPLLRSACNPRGSATRRESAERGVRGLRRRVAGAVCVLVLGLIPGAGAAQDNDFATLPAGTLRLGVDGLFWSADERFGLRTDGGTRIEEVEPLAFDLLADNGAGLFPGTGLLGTTLQAVLADPAYTPVLGESRSYLQASQVRAPLQLEVGVTNWFTLGVTVPFVQSRLEGDINILPAANADVGINPAFIAPSQVESFTTLLTDRALLLPAGTAETWVQWAQSFTAAYGSSSLFPATGTGTALALEQALADFNAVLTANGIATVTDPIPLAAAVLDYALLQELLSGSEANLGIAGVPTANVWGLGDVTVRGRVQLLRGEHDPLTGRPRWGVTALGAVHIPTGAPLETRLLMPIMEADGALAFSGGGAGWIRTERFGLGGSGGFTVFRPAEVERRIGPADQVILPSANLTAVERSPGSLLQIEVRPSIRMGAALWLEGSYRLMDRGGDRYTRITPLPGAPLLPGPIPDQPTFTNATLLAQETGMTAHLIGGGLRYHPPEGEIPLEGWVRLERAVSGSGGRTLKETRLSFGLRLTRRLWGG